MTQRVAHSAGRSSGGNEFGESWHREGRLTSKQNVFDDFAAAAQALESAGWTSPRHLGIIGESNGGLLMGAALTRPQTECPAVLLETGENDPRVAPWQSRKFAAALQAATTSGLPVLLLTRRAAGHGNIGASFSQRVGNAAAPLIFFDNELR